MSPEDIPTAMSKNVSNYRPNMSDEFFTRSATVKRNHPKYVAILLGGSENEGDAPSVRPGRVIQFCLPKNEYLASPIDFRACQSPLRSFEEWMRFMISQDRVRDSLTRAQILDAIMASATLQIRKKIVGLVAFISRWCPNTHTSICRWSEMTISLESVAVLLNLPITGNLDITLSDEEEEMRVTLVAKSTGFVRKDYETKCFYSWWVSEWFSKDSVLDQMKNTLHVASFMDLWLSRDILDDGSGKKEIRHDLIKLAIKLAKGVVLHIGGLFLGSLYTHMDHLGADICF
ncbi:uncharacterized protein LOC113306694 [Papaver somniferum]|uniref:uncharacterized protein LOC113306694 n=1 Tax=Papaver somniferum TaxID=3469 RepID=UPI000E6FB597|nr:uncharacterized protein LOC113306694 [Papaver somniferum]